VRHRKQPRIGRCCLWLGCGEEKIEGFEEIGLGREGPGVGAGDGEAEDGEEGVAEGGGHVGHGVLLPFFFLMMMARSGERKEGRRRIL
jgi:hypothetical protein